MLKSLVKTRRSPSTSPLRIVVAANNRVESRTVPRRSAVWAPKKTSPVTSPLSTKL
jgi:hypothetical protein